MALSATEHHRRRGHVARALKKYLREHSLTVRQFNEQVLNAKPGWIVPYSWLSAKSTPSPEMVQILSPLLGHKPTFFQPRGLPAPDKKRGKRMNGETEGLGLEMESEPQGVGGGLAGGAGGAATTLADVREGVQAMWQRSDDRTPARKRVAALVADMPVVNPVLTFVSHGDGTSTVQLNLTAPSARAHAVFAALAELGVDRPEPDNNADRNEKNEGEGRKFTIE